MNEAADFYSRHLDKHAENWELKKQSQEFIDLLDEFVRRVNGGKILDAGCGPGHHTEYFENHGLDSVGIDASKKSIEYARDNKKGSFQIMDIRDLDFDKNSFDGVWCNAAIFFLPPEEMKSTIEELKRVTKPEAVIYLSFKVGDGKTQREKHDDSVTQYHLSIDEIKSILRSTNLEIIDRGGTERDTQKFANFFCKKQDK